MIEIFKCVLNIPMNAISSYHKEWIFGQKGNQLIFWKYHVVFLFKKDNIFFFLILLSLFQTDIFKVDPKN